MENIHPEILSSLDNIFKKRQRPLSLHTEYRKWLRYFLDFQTKYPQPGEQSVQVRLFSENLRSKGQTEMQVKQAADAISLFFNSQRKTPVAHSSTRAGAVHHTAVAVVAEQPGTHGPARSPARKASCMVAEPPGPPVPDEQNWRRKEVLRRLKPAATKAISPAAGPAGLGGGPASPGAPS